MIHPLIRPLSECDSPDAPSAQSLLLSNAFFPMIKPNLIGYNGHIHDSAAEAKASFQLAKFGIYRCNDFYPVTFTDSKGQSFPARQDFYGEDLNLSVEVKAADLNPVKNKASSNKQIADKRVYRSFNNQPLLLKDWLDFGWHHARRKQCIVQHKLTPQNFIVAFVKPPSIDAARTYTKDRLVFMPLSAIPSYIAYLKLQRRGLAVSFSLSYDIDDSNEMLGYSIGPVPPEELNRRFEASGIDYR